MANGVGGAPESEHSWLHYLTGVGLPPTPLKRWVKNKNFIYLSIRLGGKLRVSNPIFISGLSPIEIFIPMFKTITAECYLSAYLLPYPLLLYVSAFITYSVTLSKAFEFMRRCGVGGACVCGYFGRI